MTWHDGFQVWLSESQSLDNAQKIINYFYVDGTDWSKESLSAMIGNMRHESSVNPNMYEYGYNWSDNRGYGLVQWTPRSKFWDWAISKKLEPEKPESQLARIDFEVDENIQYLTNGHQVRYGRGDKYDFSFSAFRSNSPKLDVNQLTEAFMWNYEGPNYQKGLESLPARQAFANRVYKELEWGTVTPKPEPKPEPEIDFSGVYTFFENFIKELTNKIEEMLTIDLYKYGNNKILANKYLKLVKQLEHMYKVRPTINLLGAINELGEKGLKNLNDTLDKIKPKPEPDPGEGNKGDKFFPVDYNATGINFWFPPYDSNLTKNMDFGTRSNGDFHAGYDIGGGGINHNVYAVTGGTVLESRQIGGWGQTIIIEHDSDKYFSLYAHLVVGSQTVQQGDTIKAGQLLGKMGASGGNYSIHLHYELSTSSKFDDDGDVIDPKNYLGITGNNKTSLKNPAKVKSRLIYL